MNVTKIVVGVGVALGVACGTRHNPASCCTSTLQCASLGLDEMHSCGGLLVCDDTGTCVAPQCVTSADCKDPSEPLCSDMLCVAMCSDDSQCAAATPHCGPAGACVECTESGQCPSTTPVCDQATNTCVQAPPVCVPELLELRANAAFGIIAGQLFHISPSDLVEHAVFSGTDQSDGAYSPDASKLAWLQSNQTLWISDAAGQNPVKIDDVSQNSTFTAISHLRWSPTGARLAYQEFPVGQADTHIWVAALTGNPMNITSNAEADSPEWSPDGSKILFESTRTGDIDIFTMSADGSNQTNLTHTTRDQQSPHWSPDGNSIVFFGPYNGTSSNAIWVMNSDGSSAHAITSPPSGEGDIDPHWLSNQQIIYGHAASGLTQLYVTSPQGTNQHIFAASTAGVDQTAAMPSPDGKYVAWSEEDTAQNTQLWLSPIASPTATRITNSVGINNVALGWKRCP